MSIKKVTGKLNHAGNLWKWTGVLAVLILVLAACQTSTPTPTATESVEEQAVVVTEELKIAPSVTVSDQSIESGSVKVDQVTSDGPGWIVIHAQAEGKPGPIIGFSQVVDGENADVLVDIDPAKATETLYAMLHSDLGEGGSFEFPDGPDVPVKVGEKVVTPPFKVTAGLVEIIPEVLVEDQSIENGSVMVSKVLSQGPGWLVVHAQADGKPGPIIGFSPIADGENLDVVIDIEIEKATETLYAMLHADLGEVGAFEFPDGPDTPVTVEGDVVTPPFAVTGGLQADALIQVAESDELGQFLTDSAGMTLYTFAKDLAGVTSCYDQCAVNWPPLFLGEGQELTAGEGISGELASIERTDGGMQVTYNGLPLYYWVNDTEPGQTSGHGVNEVWAVARPEVSLVQVASNEQFGDILVGPDGMTLYIFTNDQPGVTNCYDQCAVNWPPLMLAEGQPLTGGAGVTGELGTTERTDGGRQVTYNGWPLYYWVQDTAPGQTSGHLVNNVWFVATPKNQVTQIPATNADEDTTY